MKEDEKLELTETGKGFTCYKEKIIDTKCLAAFGLIKTISCYE